MVMFDIVYRIEANILTVFIFNKLVVNNAEHSLQW